MHRDYINAILRLYRVISENCRITLSDELIEKYGLAPYLDILKEEGVIVEEGLSKEYVKGDNILGLNPDEEIISKKKIGRFYIKVDDLEEKFLELILPKEYLRLKVIKRDTGLSIFHAYTRGVEFYVYLLKCIPDIRLHSYILEKFEGKSTLIFYPPSRLASLYITLLFAKTIAGQYIASFNIPSTIRELEQTKDGIRTFIKRAGPLNEILYKYAMELKEVYEYMRVPASIIKYNPLLLIRLLLDIEHVFSKNRPKDVGLPMSIGSHDIIHRLAEYVVALALAYMYHPNVYLGRIGGRDYPDIFLRKDNEIIIVDVKCCKDPSKLPSRIRSELKEKKKGKKEDKKYFKYIPIAKKYFGLMNKQTINTLVFITSCSVNNTIARRICEVIKRHNKGQWRFNRVIIASIKNLRACLERLFSFKGSSCKELFSENNLEIINEFCSKIRDSTHMVTKRYS